jgi:hypothetical protein
MTDQLSVLPDDFDLDAWIDGTCKVTLKAKVFQRGDLITQLDELQEKIELSKKTPKEQRGVNEVSVDALMDQWEELAEQLSKSAMHFHVQDRTEARRQALRERLVKEHNLKPEEFEDSETIILHTIADAIVKVETGGKTKDFPDGFPVDKLREIKDRLGDAALSPLRDAFFKVISEAPTVSAPLSRNSSSRRSGGI